LPWRKYQTVVMVEFYRVRCPVCGLKVEAVPQMPSKAPFSKDFEDEVGLACESAAARQVARRFGLAAATVRSIDKRYLERWARSRKKPVLRQMGVDEIYLGKSQKFLTVVSNLETGEPLWFGPERKQETLDEFFRTELSPLPPEPDRGGLRGYVGTVHNQHPEMGAPMPNRFRQVSCHAARQPGGG
jgi:transposase